MNRRVIGVLVSLVLAAIGTLIIINYVRGADNRALEGQNPLEVLVVDQPIAKGTPADDLSNLVIPKLIAEDSLARGAITDLTEISGRFASVDLLPGEQLVASRFVSATALIEDIDVEVPPELLQVTVQVSPDRVLGGELLPGDLVAIVASFTPFTLDAVEPSGTDGLDVFLEDLTPEDAAPPSPLRTPNTSHIIAHKVLVTNIQADIEQPTTTDGVVDTDPRNPPPSGIVLVTIAIDAPTIERVVFTAEFGTLWFAKESPESVETGTQIQTRGTIYQ